MRIRLYAECNFQPHVRVTEEINLKFLTVSALLSVSQLLFDHYFVQKFIVVDFGNGVKRWELLDSYNCTGRKREKRGKKLALPHSGTRSSSQSNFVVEKIIRRRVNGLSFEYEVKWKGYPHTSNEWLRESAFQGDSVLLKDFKVREKKREASKNRSSVSTSYKENG